MIFVIPFLPSDWPLLEPLKEIDTEWKVIIVLLIAILLSGILYNLNTPIIRFYEGYPWKDSCIGKYRIRYHQARFEYYNVRWTGMRTLLLAMDTTDPRYSRISDKWAEIGKEFNSQFPREKSSVLPTKLGNVIKSFENYPLDQYGIDAVVLYPRLISKIDKDYAEIIADSKTNLDFMINNSLLSTVLAASILLIRLINPSQVAQLWMLTVPAPWVWLLHIVVFMGLAYAFYCLSVGRASAWGSMVKGAFDLYRWRLLEQLGYKRAPKTTQEEYAQWFHISERMLFGKSPTHPDPDYEPSPTPATSAFARPEGVALEIARGLKARNAGEPITVVLHLRNGDIAREAQEVVVTDTLPEDFDYEWDSASVHRDSASVQSGSVQVTGVNPYRFTVYNVPPHGEVLLQYRAIPRKLHTQMGIRMIE
ncbi:MAG: hypothetical protein ACRERE_27845 [Candidatus Entotheonellia bacterium]